MVVAKPLSNSTPDHNVLWRLCFYEQEREFLKGDLKPVIRMMKVKVAIFFFLFLSLL